MPKAATFTWPDRPRVQAFLGCGVLLSVLWIVVYGGTSWLTARHSYRVPLGLHVEQAIPFVPEAAVVYLSLFPMIWLSLFILPSAPDIHRFARALAWLYIVSGIGFILLPGEPGEPLPVVGAAIRPMFEFADWINLEYNFLPSLHVGLAVVCASAYSRHLSSGANLVVWTWAMAISISTLLTHQHYLADVVAGAAVGWLVAYTCLGETEHTTAEFLAVDETEARIPVRSA